MRIKSIFIIVSMLLLFQVAPLILSLFSVDIKTMLLADTFGSEVSNDAVLMFETFAFVLSSVIIGIICLILGSLSIRDLSALRRLSFLLFVIMGFLALPDLIFGISGKPTAPIPVIIANLLTMGILLYGAKRGNI
jgi:predicted membrane channel-forming protein YqfA (hemolysin III family)